MAERQNGGQNGRMAGMAEWQKEWQNGRMAEMATYVLFTVTTTDDDDDDNDDDNNDDDYTLIFNIKDGGNGGNGGNGGTAERMAEWQNGRSGYIRTIYDTRQ